MYKNLSFDFSEDSKKTILEFKAKLAPKPAHSEFTLFRTYSRLITTETVPRKETIDEIYMRVTRGVFSLIKDHLAKIANNESTSINSTNNSTISTSTNISTKWDQNKDWLEKRALRFLQILYEDKMIPPGRGLWTMGTELINVEKMVMALVNCTFISSENIDIVREEFFAFIMDCLMLGVGAGYDDLGAKKLLVTMPEFAPYNYIANKFTSKNDQYGHYISDQLMKFISDSRKNNFCDQEGVMYLQREYDYMQSVSAQTISCNKSVIIYKIKDSRDGWVDSLRALLRSYFYAGEYIVIFDYSKVRPSGQILKKFGGVSSGPIPLAEMLSCIRFLLQQRYINKYIDSLLIIDICNIIARTVVAGNVRRSSQICLSSDPNIVNAKRYDLPEYKYREKWGWASNNSFIATTNFDAKISSNIAVPLDSCKEIISRKILAKLLKNNYYNGEPGLFVLDNARKYGRVIDGANNLDEFVSGTNPCGEISLQGSTKNASNVKYSCGGETCNLFETFPCNYDDMEEFYADLEIAVLYAKTVTLLSYHWKGTDEIQKKNRRIGISMSGIALYLAKTNYDLEHFKNFCDASYKRVCKYDAEISKLFGIPESIKKTTIKPSGSVSLCANVTSGMHFPINSTYIRRIRFAETDEASYKILTDANIPIERDLFSTNTLVASFPVKLPYNCLSCQDVSVELQFEIFKILQYYWADNQVSCTLTFREEEFCKLENLLYEGQHFIKGLSLLKLNTNVYKQAPLESISLQEYERLSANIKSLNIANINSHDDIETDMYCDGDSCIYVPKRK
jgi:ribonucleoside-triphosphate reductase (thioredoxin)